MLPVISEYIGRSCSTPTMYYLGIDVKSLLECSLELPLVREDFHNQKDTIYAKVSTIRRFLIFLSQQGHECYIPIKGHHAESIIIQEQ